MRLTIKRVISICGVGTFWVFLSIFALAQEVKRCEGPGGKLTYAETCPLGTMATTLNSRGVSVTDSDKRQRADEAAFQRRHASRQRSDAAERASLRRAVAAERKQALIEEKVRRELKLKEDREKYGGKPRVVRVKKKKKNT
jgi:hypothetical protein